MTQTEKRNRRRTIVINKGFQTRYAAMAALGAIVAINVILIVSYLLYMPRFGPMITTTHTLSLGVAELLVVIVVYYYGIRTSFRIAGPMFALSRGLSQVGGGDLTVRLKFRDRDCCQEVAENFNLNIAKLEGRVSEIKKHLGEKLNQDLTVEQYKALTKEVWNELCGIKTSP